MKPTPSWILVATSLALMLYARPSLAQGQTARNPTDADRGFLGAGPFIANDDAPNRVRFPTAGTSLSPRLTIEANVIRAGRLGLGFEFSTLGTVTGSYDASCCTLRDDQRETLALGVIRARAWRNSRLAVDLVGGMGALFQHRETTTALRFVAGSPVTTLEDRRSPAFAVGIDVPFFVARHLALVPQIRIRFFERGALDTPNVTRTSSQSFAIGVTGRVLW